MTNDESTQPPSSQLQNCLEEIFDFTEQDLAANRQGSISERQIGRMTAKHYDHCRFAWWTYWAILGVGFLGFLAAMYRDGTLGINSVSYYAFMMGIVAGFLWIAILYYRFQLRKTLKQPVANKLSGPIRLQTKRGEKLHQRYFCIGQQQFRIDYYSDYVRLLQLQKANCNGTVYYSLPWHDLLSVELSK